MHLEKKCGSQTEHNGQTEGVSVQGHQGGNIGALCQTDPLNYTLALKAGSCYWLGDIKKNTPFKAHTHTFNTIHTRSWIKSARYQVLPWGRGLTCGGQGSQTLSWQIADSTSHTHLNYTDLSPTCTQEIKYYSVKMEEISSQTFLLCTICYINPWSSDFNPSGMFVLHLKSHWVCAWGVLSEAGECVEEERAKRGHALKRP